MLSLSHYRFEEKLRHVCKRIKTNLLLVPEDYTSKTCGQCGTIKEHLNAAKIYTCCTCGYKEDRDINGARNIMIKTLSDINKLNHIEREQRVSDETVENNKSMKKKKIEGVKIIFKMFIKKKIINDELL